MNYYNEFDPKAAAWLRELIRCGHIPSGDIDERSIADVQPGDLRKYNQCHFFAGIGGWSLALQLANWPQDRPVWTGSCPCQPFSNSGKQLGTADPRHFWPQFQRLIKECRPTSVFGEQVASASGRLWLDGVRTDLEGMGYGVGGADLCAASVGSPQVRQRLFWVAISGSIRSSTGISGSNQGKKGDSNFSNNPSDPECFWENSETIGCKDGRSRRIEPGIFPLVDGLPGRVGLLRGYGNAICPQLAAEFIQSVTDIIETSHA